MAKKKIKRTKAAKFFVHDELEKQINTVLNTGVYDVYETMKRIEAENEKPP